MYQINRETLQENFLLLHARNRSAQCHRASLAYRELQSNKLAADDCHAITESRPDRPAKWLGPVLGSDFGRFWSPYNALVNAQNAALRPADALIRKWN